MWNNPPMEQETYEGLKIPLHKKKHEGKVLSLTLADNPVNMKQGG